jgi:hypothetical protein
MLRPVSALSSVSNSSPIRLQRSEDRPHLVGPPLALDAVSRTLAEFIAASIAPTSSLMPLCPVFTAASEPINLGSSQLVTINGLVDIVEGIAGVKLDRNYNLSAPQGVRGRNSDNTLIREQLGWEPSISLEDGLEKTYRWIHEQMTSGAVDEGHARLEDAVQEYKFVRLEGAAHEQTQTHVVAEKRAESQPVIPSELYGAGHAVDAVELPQIAAELHERAWVLGGNVEIPTRLECEGLRARQDLGACSENRLRRMAQKREAKPL